MIHEADEHPTRTIHFDPVANRTHHYWHIYVPDLKPGQIYGYRIAGPFDPANGMSFDPSKVLLDPYGRGVAVPTRYSRRQASSSKESNTASAMKSVVIDLQAYNWEGGEAVLTNHHL